MKFNCPSCGAEVVFKSRFSIMGVCEYCSSTIVRHDQNLEDMGKMSEIGEDMSPLQIGSTGIYEKKSFEIIGRQKAIYNNGSWNEWYIIFGDGKEGWLAEAQGFYMVSFEKEDHKFRYSDQKPGEVVTIGNVKFFIDDIKEIVYKGVEGELPKTTFFDSKATSIDLSAPNNEFCNVLIQSDKTYMYLGKYIDFDDLKFKNLRELDGWR
jgi:hypothetical protein